MDALTDHVQILAQICLLSLIWDRVLMLPHLRLQVIYRVLQVIWQVDQRDHHQVKEDLLQMIWQVDQRDLLQVIWVLVKWDQRGLLQVIWVLVKWDQMDHHQVIWQVDQNSDQQPLLLIWDPMDLLQAWIWMEMECLLHLPVVKGQIHYLVKMDQLVDHRQVICLLPAILEEMDQVECLQVIWDQNQAICLLQTEWMICIRTWTMLVLIIPQRDLLQVKWDQSQAICRQICLRLLTTQMMAVK